jgi:hypothetical protein
MDQICLVVPILPGRTADAKDFMRELEAGRNADYQRSEQRIGIVKEAWYLARTPAGDQLVAYMEAPTSPRRSRRSPSPKTSSTGGSNNAWPMPPALT